MTKQEFIKLYLLCFSGDDLEDAERMWKLAKSGKIIYHTENGQLVSMIILLPAILKAEVNTPIYYIFAASTHPDFRRRGIMEMMLNKAFDTALEDGKSGVFLRPASAKLCEYYCRHCFVPFAFYNTTEMAVENCEKNFLKLDYDSFCRFRAKHLKTPYIERGEPFLKATFEYLEAYSDGENLIVCEFQNKTLCVREHFGNTKDLICSVANKFGCEKILVRHFGSGEPYALIRANTDVPNTYVGLCLDAF